MVILLIVILLFVGLSLIQALIFVLGNLLVSTLLMEGTWKVHHIVTNPAHYLRFYLV